MEQIGKRIKITVQIDDSGLNFGEVFSILQSIIVALGVDYIKKYPEDKEVFLKALRESNDLVAEKIVERIK